MCGAGESRILFAKKLSVDSPVFHLVQCLECGFCFVKPTPERETQRSFYKSERFTSSAHDLKRFNKKKWRFTLPINKLSLQLFKNYRFYPLKNSLWLKILVWPCRIIALKNIMPYQGNGRFLDVGCNNGMYLAILKALGWETYGVEQELSLYNEAKERVDMAFHGTLEEAKFPDKYFDVIRFNQVFEHVEDPVLSLEEAKRILSDQGRIYIEVPNQKSFAFYAFKEDFYGCPMHLHIFSPETMALLCKKTGLKIKRIKIRSSPGLIRNCLKDRYKRSQNKFKKVFSLLICGKLFELIFIKPFCAVLQILGQGDIFEVELTK
ncbi:MAG: class I SAM-dependent methyltransferase [Candidatus Omnitrophota bacterium]